MMRILHDCGCDLCLWGGETGEERNKERKKERERERERGGGVEIER